MVTPTIIELTSGSVHECGLSNCLNTVITFVGDKSTVNFTGALQTEHVRSPPFKHLELHSPTRSVYLEAPEKIDINTKGGDIAVKSKFEALFSSSKVLYASSYVLRNKATFLNFKIESISILDSEMYYSLWYSFSHNALVC